MESLPKGEGWGEGEKDALLAELLRLTDDPDPRVRYQLAFTFGEMTRPERADALARIAQRDGADPQIAAAILSAPPAVTGELFTRLSSDAKFVASPAGESFLRQIVQIIGAKNDAKEVTDVLGFLGLGQASPTLVAALGEGLRRAGTSLVTADTGGRLKSIIGHAAGIASNRSAPPAQRAESLELATLYMGGWEGLGMISAALGPEEKSELVQLAALRVADKFKGAADGLAGLIIPRLKDFSPAVRSAAMSVLLARPERSLALLKAIESGDVKRGDLNTAQLDALHKSKDKQVAALATKLFPPERKVSRDELVKQFSAALTLKGDVAKGRAIYAERCISCHRAEGQGFALGPDLVTVKTTGREKLLLNIIYPNKEVAPQFLAFNLETKDGESYSGLIVSDTAAGVTLRQAFGKEDVIARAKIKSMRSPGQSLMPEDLQAGLTPQQMADLLEFIEALK